MNHQPQNKPESSSSPTDRISASPSMSNEDHNDLSTLLTDAYSAPPVPASLAARMEQQITERWGKSPQIAPPERNVPGWIRKARSLGSTVVRRWSVSLAAAASLMLVVAMTMSSGGYAWATVIKAIRQNGFIQRIDGDQTSVLDLSTNSVTSESGQRIVWQDQEAMLVAFLRREPMTDEVRQRYQGLQVVDESWKEIERDGEKHVELSVTCQTKDEQQFSLNLHLDPTSRLPHTVHPDAGQALALVCSDSVPDLSATVAESGGVDSPARETDPPENEASDLLADTSASVSPEREEPGNRAVVPAAHAESLPKGAPNKWAPVKVVSRNHDETLREVNRVLQQLWQEEGVEPVERASDLELMRRAYLDLAGRIPSVTEVREFIDRPENGRYQAMIDELLQSPDHPSQLAAIWRSFLIPEGVDLEAFGGREAFEQWLTNRFASVDSYDKIVRELLLAEGRLTQSGPLLFYASLKLDADQLAARTSRAFLGMRLECAQCHDHFFEAWTQDDFWSFAAFFAQISRPKGDLENVSTVMRVSDVERGEVMFPETETVVAPRFLGTGNNPASTLEVADGDRRRQLAAWLTGSDNPYFARATVNRVWAQLFGRGIVDPVDDFGSSNDAVSPELLDTLASYFIDTNFDLQALIRVIAHSDAYQLSSSHTGTETETEATDRLKMFAQMNVKTLTAEQLYDCIAVATVLDGEAMAGGDGLSRFGNSRREQFLQTFAAPQTNLSEYPGGIPQALTLMNGSLSANATGESTSGLIRSLQAPFFSDEQRIEIVYLATLSRKPTETEKRLVAEFIPADASTEQRRQGLADLLWVLINSSEFTLNH